MLPATYKSTAGEMTQSAMGLLGTIVIPISNMIYIQPVGDDNTSFHLPATICGM